ncbi:HDOD domain-containing protein [Simiduia agarivorans]|uniref:Signal transduction protein n=1 Tax=Simiduia agarivorans (strain DSM 21679 / JCM 13881 / BCRC 17597 / SA1) TaxID=1117647 RepID=K4KKV9_SIMAS|nr:HDOD domain-containing protein [Simiduia agarivorans]AFU98870.1 signal transduction protein [Simiduia agarivorans SA1 = DSM 21679]
MSDQALSDAANTVAGQLQHKIDQRQLDVPMLPEVASKVVTLSQDPESDAAKLAQLIQSDQALAGHVMHIANSAAYTPNASLVSLQQAITRLGMNLISDIALAASISAKMFKAPGYESHINYIWRHALATALWGKEIARVCRRNVEATFLCGLLHSIGRPVTIQCLLELAKKNDTELTEQDMQLLEEKYHTPVGIAVAQRWQMPQIVCESIEFFHAYENANLAREQTTMINGGAAFATHLLKPEVLGAAALGELPVLADLNLYDDEIATLMDKKDDIKSTMEAMLGR